MRKKAIISLTLISFLLIGFRFIIAHQPPKTLDILALLSQWNIAPLKNINEVIWEGTKVNLDNGGILLRETEGRILPMGIKKIVVQPLGTPYIQSIEVFFEGITNEKIKTILRNMRKDPRHFQEVLSQEGLWIFLDTNPKGQDLIYYILSKQNETYSLAIFTETANNYFKKEQGVAP